MLVNNKAIDAKFNSPVYIFKAKVFIAELFRPMFKKDENRNRDG
jgi:hypothetical protein